MNFIAIIIAVIVTYFVSLSIKAQKKNREKQMRETYSYQFKRAATRVNRLKSREKIQRKNTSIYRNSVGSRNLQ